MRRESAARTGEAARRGAGRVRRVAVLGALWLAAAPAARAVDLVRPEEQLLAIFTLETQLRMEADLLARLEVEYAENLDERDRYLSRLVRLYEELDQRWQDPEERFDAEEAARGDEELERLEKAQQLAWDEGRRLRREMLRLRARLELLRDQVRLLTQALPGDTETLTGYWDVVLLSTEERGVFYLVQSGAVLTGEYAVTGGYRGSLQGTLVDGQVVLHRIDTKLGRVMDLSGLVSVDGKAIRGTWTRYELSGGKPATGAWTATRRSTLDPGGEGGEP